MALGGGDPVPCDDAVKIVARLVRIKAARQPDRAQDSRGKGALLPRKRMLEEAVVEAGVVRHEDGIGRHRSNRVCHTRERRCIAYHRIRDAGERLDFGRDGHAGIDEGAPFRDAGRRRTGGIGLDANDSDLRDRVGRSRRPRGFEVDEGEGGREQAHGEKGSQGGP